MNSHTLTTIWPEICQYLNTQLSTHGYQTFLSLTTPVSYENNILTIEVSTIFSRDWIKEKCESLIETYFQNNHNFSILIHYHIHESTDSISHPPITLFSQKPNPTLLNPSFNPKYTFENFIVGHNNRFAHAASEAVSKAPSKAYNPLFIYGSAGLGKTHLLHAIGNKIIQNFPSKKIYFVSSEKFTNDLINAIKEKRMEVFRDIYRKADVLLVDDIQFLAGKTQTQEEFFHTFNDLHGNNGQIVLTSDRPPKDIPTLEERLRTRFEWGLIADIQPPELETRIAILKNKVEQDGIGISDEVLHFIATQVPSNVREMEGALTRVVAYASLLSTEISLSMASNVIKDMFGTKQQEKPLTITQIKRIVCEYFQIDETELCSKDRSKDVVYPRQITMYLVRELTNTSLPKIGESFGKRDHTTVMHACDRIKSLISTDPDTRNIINVLISNINNNHLTH